MVFNSLTFLLFIFLFFPLYFGTKGRRRIWVCLLASYLFYGWWDWRFLSLIVFSTVMDGWFGMWLSYLDDPAGVRGTWERGSWVARMFGRLTLFTSSWGLPRKAVLVFSMVMNLGFLGFFKYFNFFAEGFASMVQALGMTPSWTTLHVILPVGFSFYTFHSMSYTIDVYRR